jgi:endonuclease/exonuclease/phosphatase family metal-dependent hydrolase
MGAPKDEQTKHIEAVREEIRKLNPDILLLQEVGSQAALEETLQPLGKEWKVAVVSRFMQGNFLSGQQLAIAAKLPADAAWSEPWQRGWAGAPRGYAYASFLVGQKRLGVYCLHLKSNLGNPPENTSKREDAIEQLIAHTNAKEERLVKPDALLMGGDFNTDDPDTPAALSPSERTFSFLRKAGLQWSFEGIEHQNRITCPKKGSYPAACFDYFWSKGLGKPLSSVHPAEGSDHLPVVLEISL